MVIHRRLPRSFAHFLAALVIGLPGSAALAQKVGRDSTQPPVRSGGAGGPKVGRDLPAKPTEVAAPVAVVRSNEGALALFAVRQAAVAIAPLRGAGPGKPFEYQLGAQKNTLSLARMRPGSYQLTITHPDYHPYSATVAIKQGEPTVVNAELVSKYGEVVVDSDPGDASVSLLTQPGIKARPDDRGVIVIPRVPVGDHEVKVSKAGYDDRTEKLKVYPGKQTPVAVKLTRSTVTLTVKSRPEARIYLNNEEKGAVRDEAGAVISNLLPGDYQMRVALDGYEEVVRPLSLSLDVRQKVETVELVPIAESSEGAETLQTGTIKWLGAEAWRQDKRGIYVSGDRPVLFKGATEKRPFNFYRDFDLTFDLRFANGKGAAWILRAKDPGNYYLVELATRQSVAGRKVINFYLCRDGKCELKDSNVVVENLERGDDSYTIRVEARGPKLTHFITVASAPKSGGPQPLATFEDDTFRIGGVGFRGINGTETLLQTFFVQPVLRAARQ